MGGVINIATGPSETRLRRWGRGNDRPRKPHFWRHRWPLEPCTWVCTLPGGTTGIGETPALAQARALGNAAREDRRMAGQHLSPRAG